MGVYVALLRGINLGGKNRVSMKHLAELFGQAGASEVRTYIQSGNVAFEAGAEVARKVPASIEKAIAAELGLKVPVVLRSAKELAAVAKGNPYLKAGADPDALHVAFLAEKPAAAKVAALDPARAAPDAFEVRGREVYLHLPNGMARTKLSNAWFDSKLGTVSTMRNWRTVLALLDLARG